MGGGRTNVTQSAEPYNVQMPYVNNILSSAHTYGQPNPYNNRQIGGQQSQFSTGPLLANSQSSFGPVANNPHVGMPVRASSGSPYGNLANLLQAVFSNNRYPPSGNYGGGYGVPGPQQIPPVMTQNYPAVPQLTPVARGPAAGTNSQPVTNDRSNRLGMAANTIATLMASH